MNGAPGFLERLAQRAQGLESGIRPVLPPLFAPPSGETAAGLPALEENNEPAPEPQPTSLSNPRMQSPPPATQALPPVNAAVVHPLAEQSIPRPTSHLMPPEMHHSLGQTETFPSPALPPARPASPQAPETEATLLPGQTPPARVEVTPSPDQAEPAAKGAPPESEALLLPPLPPPAIFNQVVGTKAAAPGAAPQRDETPAPPAVRINIGRIEVRAAFQGHAPPVAPAPRADPHPSMTLDEYLRRLNEEAK